MPRTAAYRRAGWAALTVAAAAAAIGFGDRVGFEGDDLAVITGASHLDTVTRDGLYRFAWQPLAYVGGHALTTAGLPPLGLTYVGNIFGVAGLVLLVAALNRVLGGTRPVWLAVAIVAAVPELWMTSLYFNTTALGLPFMTGALFLLAAPSALPAGGRDATFNPWRSAAAGAALAVACLLRFDFAATIPALAVIAGLRAPAWRVRSALLLVAVCCTVVLIGLGILGLSPADTAAIARSHGRAPQTAWQSAMVLGVAVLPLALAWPVLVVLIWRSRIPRLPVGTWALIGLAALPGLYPVTALYSAKYLVPAFCLALFAFACWTGRTPLRPAASRMETIVAPACVAIAGLALLFVGLERDPSGGRVALSRTPLMHWTHDGPRTFGGYASLLRYVREGTTRPGYITFNRAVAGWIQRAPSDADVILVDPRVDAPALGDGVLVSEWTWGWPAIYLESAGWSLQAHEHLQRLTLVSPEGRRASILAASRPPDTLPESGCVLVIGPVVATDSAERELARLARQVQTAGCQSAGRPLR